MMTIQELIESAVLDAYALLDPEDQIAFDRAFDSASPRVQAMVRAEQARLATPDRLLPDRMLPNVDAPEHLRALVLGRIREEIAAEYLGDEYLGDEFLGEQIGDGERGGRPSFFQIMPSRRVSPVWRAAAIGSLAAAVVFGVSVLQMSWQYDGLRNAIAKNQLLEEVTRQFGSRYVRDVLFDVDTRRVVLASASENFGGEAALFWNPGWESAQLYCAQLASRDGRTYRLAIVDEEDRVVRDLLTFEASGGLNSESVALDPQEIAASNRRLALIPSDEDAPVMHADVRSLLGTS